MPSDAFSTFYNAYSHLSSRTLFTMLSWEQYYPEQTERWGAVRNLLSQHRFVSRRVRRNHYEEFEL